MLAVGERIAGGDRAAHLDAGVPHPAPAHAARSCASPRSRAARGVRPMSACCSRSSSRAPRPTAGVSGSGLVTGLVRRGRRGARRRVRRAGFVALRRCTRGVRDRCCRHQRDERPGGDRLVPGGRRGFAMGIRQMALPLGTECRCRAGPGADGGRRDPPAFLAGGVIVAIAAVASAAFIVNPHRPARATGCRGASREPATAERRRCRASTSSPALLVVPQYRARHVRAGLARRRPGAGTRSPRAVVVATAPGARRARCVAVGALSDRLGSRLPAALDRPRAASRCCCSPRRRGALHSAGTAMVACYVLASCVSVADNGLAFTAVAEIAGAHWSGRARLERRTPGSSWRRRSWGRGSGC